MNYDDLKLIVEQSEGLKLDFKREFYKIAVKDYSPSTPEQKRKEFIELQWGELLKDVLSIVNGNVNTASQEGYLVVGVEDDTKAVFDVGDVDNVKLRQQLIKKLSDISNPPVPDLSCDLLTFEDKRLLLITIPPSPHLHETTRDLRTPNRVYPKHTVFVRRGEGIEPASQAERTAILAEKQRWLNAPQYNSRRPSKIEQAHYEPQYEQRDNRRYSEENGTIPVPRERFAKSITAWMAKLKKKVEWLTADQTEVLRQLRYKHKALITGCAGSGKTLLVAEKAIRLDAAGIRTLVLCHNPNLARYLTSLIANPAIDVYDFSTLVSQLADKDVPEQVAWTVFEEPLDEDLNKAFDSIDATNAVYEAVIVDEGQDFRDEWWILVDALLQYSRTKTLYIFYDDNQALLPYRAHYPINCDPISISKNCRNGGNIFEIVRRFHRDAPLTSSFLTDAGVAKITPFDEQDFRVRLENTLLDAYNYANHEQIRLLTNEPSSEISKLNGFEFIRQTECRWRPIVHGHLHAMRDKALKRALRLRSGSSNSEIANRFGIPHDRSLDEYLTVPLLSQEKLPSAEDVKAVQEFASKVMPFFGGECNLTTRFVVNNRELCLTANRPQVGEILANDRSKAHYYSQPNWASSLQVGQPTKVVANQVPGLDEYVIPLYSVDAYKGLECDALVLVIGSASHNLLREMYVGTSRAVCYLNIVISKSVLSRLKSLEDLHDRFRVK